MSDSVLKVLQNMADRLDEMYDEESIGYEEYKILKDAEKNIRSVAGRVQTIERS